MILRLAHIERHTVTLIEYTVPLLLGLLHANHILFQCRCIFIVFLWIVGLPYPTNHTSYCINVSISTQTSDNGWHVKFYDIADGQNGLNLFRIDMTPFRSLQFSPIFIHFCAHLNCSAHNSEGYGPIHIMLGIISWHCAYHGVFEQLTLGGLRILATHEAKMSILWMFCLTLLIDHLSKICITLWTVHFKSLPRGYTLRKF